MSIRKSISAVCAQPVCAGPGGGFHSVMVSERMTDHLSRPLRSRRSALRAGRGRTLRFNRETEAALMEAEMLMKNPSELQGFSVEEAFAKLSKI